MLEKDVQNNCEGAKGFENLASLLHRSYRDDLKVRSLEIVLVNKKRFGVVIDNKNGRTTGINLTHHLGDVIYFRLASIGHGQDDGKSRANAGLTLDRDATSQDLS